MIVNAPLMGNTENIRNIEARIKQLGMQALCDYGQIAFVDSKTDEKTLQ